MSGQTIVIPSSFILKQVFLRLSPIRLEIQCNYEIKEDGTHHKFFLVPMLTPCEFTETDICDLYITNNSLFTIITCIFIFPEKYKCQHNTDVKIFYIIHIHLRDVLWFGYSHCCFFSGSTYHHMQLPIKQL